MQEREIYFPLFTYLIFNLHSSVYYIFLFFSIHLSLYSQKQTVFTLPIRERPDESLDLVSASNSRLYKLSQELTVL